MKLKRFIATAAATSIAATAVIAPASAQDSSEDLSSTFSNSSDAGTGETPDYETNPDFVPGEEGSSQTGSSAADLTLIFGGTAASLGLQHVSGSSEYNRLYQGGLDFDLERLARTNGFPEIADQLAALKATSSQPASN